MLTKNDLKAIKQIVQETAATKDDLDKLVSKNVFDQFKDRILTLLDKVMGELKAIREEQTIITGYTGHTRCVLVLPALLSAGKPAGRFSNLISFPSRLPPTSP